MTHVTKHLRLHKDTVLLRTGKYNSIGCFFAGAVGFWVVAFGQLVAGVNDKDRVASENEITDQTTFIALLFSCGIRPRSGNCKTAKYWIQKCVKVWLTVFRLDSKLTFSTLFHLSFFTLRFYIFNDYTSQGFSKQTQDLLHNQLPVSLEFYCKCSTRKLR